MKLDILAIGAHPDDVELGAGATLALEIKKGKKVGIVDLSRGELGTRGTAELRDEESKNASEILGVTVRENLDLGDGFFDISKDNLIKLIELIREYQPEVLIINSIKDRHPDHSRASEFCSRAAFLSGLIKIETSYKGKPQVNWRPKNVYSYIQWKSLEPDFVVDVSETIDIKIEAILAYKSQFFDPNSEEPETPISSKQFLESIKNVSAELGRVSNVKFAEGFKVEKPICINSLFDIH